MFRISGRAQWPQLGEKAIDQLRSHFRNGACTRANWRLDCAIGTLWKTRRLLSLCQTRNFF